MIPTEHEGTIAVDAAARALWEATNRAMGIDPIPEFADLHPIDANSYREQVLPLVWAALEALPDRRHNAWHIGFAAGVADATSVSAGQTYRLSDNPFPADPAWRPRRPNPVEEDWLVRNTDWTPDDDPDEYLPRHPHPEDETR